MFDEVWLLQLQGLQWSGAPYGPSLPPKPLLQNVRIRAQQPVNHPSQLCRGLLKHDRWREELLVA